MSPTDVEYGQLDLNLLRKVRCRVLDRRSGEPIAGVVVLLELELGRDGSRARLPVSALCSDATGYLSFDLKQLIDAGVDSAGALLVSAPQLGVEGENLLAALLRPPGGDPGDDTGDTGDTAGHARTPPTGWTGVMLPSGSERPSGIGSLRLVFPIWGDKAQVERAGCATPGLPAVQAPDAADYEVSPYSFVMLRPSNLDADCCEQLAPSALPVQEHSFYKVVIHQRRTPERGPSDSPSPPVEPVDVTEALKTPEKARVKFAHVLEYQQRWFAIGHALGEIKYSLPLAPGESTQLAVIEWSRDDSAGRYDQARETEFLEHDLRRDRAIIDAIDAGLSESQGGSSFLAGASSAMNYDTILWGEYGGNWSLGGGSSNSWGNRDILGDFQNELHDHVAQATGFVRSQRSTVIVQATQAEKSALQTRRVANHNHCHALTIQYYEVLRHYRMETHYVGRRNAILIPFKSITAFTSALALQFRTLLEKALQDRQLSYCFDSLVRLAIGPDAYGEEPEPGTGTGSQGGEEEEVGEEETADEFFSGEKTEADGITVDSQLLSNPTGLLIEKGSTVRMEAKMGPDGEVKFGWGQTGGFGLKGAGDGRDTDYRWPGWNRLRPLPAGALCAEIGGDQWMVGYGATHVAEEEGELLLFFNDPTIGDNKGTAIIKKINVKSPKKEPKPPAPGAPKQSDEEQTGLLTQRADRICERRLLEHLNANLGYYNRAIWLLMDQGQRRMYLEEALGEDNGLLYGIDDIPLTVSGSRVVFPFNGPLPEEALFEELRPKPRTSIVTLPTRGLFAEAQLGHCNACEVRDITRMWNWAEMTAEELPDISGITPGPRGQAPQLTPPPFPTSVVQITQPPEAPVPTGVGAALSLLGAANLFRDMSGLDDASALLGKLAAGLVRSPEEVKQTAKEAKEKIDTARGEGGTNGTGGPKPRQTPMERFDNYQVAKAIADELGLDDKQREDLVRRFTSGAGEDEVTLQSVGAVATAAADAALEVGSDIVKRVVDDFIKEPDLTMGRVEDAFVCLLGYTDPSDYNGPPTGARLFEDIKIYVQLENLGGSGALDGLNATYEVSWDDGYRIDPEALKPLHKVKKAYLPLINCKRRLFVTPIAPRAGKAVSEIVVKANVFTDKEIVPAWERTPGYNVPRLILPTVDLGATLSLAIKFKSVLLAQSTPEMTVKIPISRFHSYETFRVVNRRDSPEGLEVIWPPDRTISA